MRRTDDPEDPYDPYCERFADEINSVQFGADMEGETVVEFAKSDGTYNPENGHFACDACYIRLGQPSAPHPGPGWKAE